jgi:DNA topoisomerase IB
VTRSRRSDCKDPGIAPRRRGRGFSYTRANGDAVKAPETLERISALVIPPALVDVWICPWPHGHIQVLGTDKAGRRQYLYHEAWRRPRDRQKFERVLDFGRSLPRIRARPRKRTRPSASPRSEGAMSVSSTTMVIDLVSEEASGLERQVA